MRRHEMTANPQDRSLVDDRTLAERLRAHAVLGNAPEWELVWLQTHGTLQRFEVGDLLTRAGEPVEGVYAVLSGRVTIHVEKAYGRRKIMEWCEGDVTGKLPFSRMGVSPGDSVAEEETDVFWLPQEHVPSLIQTCPETTALFVHVMLDRARRFTSSDLQDQKALALGKVAAGLAHELNNPASALVRSVKALLGTLEKSRAAVRALAVQGLTGDEFSVIDGIKAASAGGEAGKWSPLERADREDVIMEWLGDVDGDVEEAGALADAPIGLDELRDMTTSLPLEKRSAALHWLACWLTASQVSEEIDDSAKRIFQLVSAVKGFTHMDRALNPELLDLREGIEQSLALIQGKANATGVTITANLPTELPRVRGVAGELSQMWHSLLDNAVDAAGAGGKVSITATGEDGRIRVEVVDDGPGIPEDVRDRIFDPFFTTKPVDQGTGLGLELVRRVVGQHRGEIDVSSVPSRTVFLVTLRSEGP